MTRVIMLQTHNFFNLESKYEAEEIMKELTKWKGLLSWIFRLSWFENDGD